MAPFVVCAGPPYTQVQVLSQSKLSPEDLKALVDEQDAGALILGGSGLFKADGMTHFGVRKLISKVTGVTYGAGGSLPAYETPPAVTPILLCRAGNDDADSMLMNFLKQAQLQEPQP
eukprot:CAMPEP_0119112888 /NCGR_PEP_ID=MMETSP1180-20130426/42102_1 /TAXON_ID=3052 ORGANISM="Chlamydomonas cf sp, Strain CCMP681" /NCGR_SAMPLE_ID=MMETSP1180 /ASSEMBLY_ACC=CAM_ASM_000741 /LENGTH=116 /DNA_ID=CAMNT_0007100651 /DNA_START=63 /DNA_END=413 /DNA_ORIENTATION=-